MDFSWPEEYLNYKEQVIRFAQSELNEEVIERDTSGAFVRALWNKCADFGLQGLSVPAKYGGSLEEVDFLRAMLAMEGFGYGCEDNGLALALNAQMWTVQLPLLEFGNEAQKQKYLTRMAGGEWIGAHALTEPEAGSDIFSMQTTAERVEGGYKLNGEKHLITLAPIADLAVVLALTNPRLGKWGISAFIVERGMAGFLQSPVKAKMGMRTVPIGTLSFENCFVPEENRLGAEGIGFSLINHSLEYDRCCILASQLGAMERQLERSIAFVTSRKQFGQPIGKFQSVSNRIADMKLRLETSRLMLYKTAWLKSRGKSAMMEAALLKLQLGEDFLASSLDAIRNYGGSAYLSENGIERDLRDAVGGVLYAGTSDIQRNIIAKLLGL
jgi:hypothetical protein